MSQSLSFVLETLSVKWRGFDNTSWHKPDKNLNPKNNFTRIM